VKPSASGRRLNARRPFARCASPTASRPRSAREVSDSGGHQLAIGVDRRVVSIGEGPAGRDRLGEAHESDASAPEQAGRGALRSGSVKRRKPLGIVPTIDTPNPCNPKSRLRRCRRRWRRAARASAATASP
jgi:hypothetical protein